MRCFEIPRFGPPRANQLQTDKQFPSLQLAPGCSVPGVLLKIKTLYWLHLVHSTSPQPRPAQPPSNTVFITPALPGGQGANIPPPLRF